MNLEKYHKTVTTIIDLLNKNSVWFEIFEHEPVRTSEEASKIRTGYKINQGAKAIILRLKFRDKTKAFAMTVLPGDKRFDNEKVKQAFEAIDIRFATEAEVGEITDGILVGGVPPFGNLFGLKVVVDPLLFKNEKIVFNAGDKRFSIGLKSVDYLNLVNPTIKEII